MNRIERLQGLILFLQSRRYATAADMADHFGLSIRTIYRDLKALGEVGVPILAEAGVGYSLMKGYSLPPVNFTNTEAFALTTGGLLLQRHTGPEFSRYMETALQKVKAILSSADRADIDRIESSMASIAKTMIPEQADLSLIQRALGKRRVLRFLYQGYGRTEAEEREVEPRGLLYYLGRWHLIAWCRLREDIRDFRTDRMRDTEMLAQGFATDGEFDPAAYVRQHMPAPNQRVRVRFEADALDRARREWWMGLLEEQAETDSGVLTLNTPDLDTIEAWLLSFGTSATVLDPPLLRTRLAERAEKTAAHHRREA